MIAEEVAWANTDAKHYANTNNKNLVIYLYIV